MVSLGLGQGVLGGFGNGAYQSKIYYIYCSHQICLISTLNNKLSVPRSSFVAIPIPDSISACISESKLASFCYLLSES